MSALTFYSTASHWKWQHLIMFAGDIMGYWEWRWFGEVVRFEKNEEEFTAHHQKRVPSSLGSSLKVKSTAYPLGRFQERGTCIWCVGEEGETAALLIGPKHMDLQSTLVPPSELLNWQTHPLLWPCELTKCHSFLSSLLRLLQESKPASLGTPFASGEGQVFGRFPSFLQESPGTRGHKKQLSTHQSALCWMAGQRPPGPAAPGGSWEKPL